jgi:hypothetical protein
VYRKKAPPPTGMVELLCDQIETTMGHCDLFQWLKKIFTPLRLTPIGLGLSVRDQVGSCFKSAPLVLSVQWELDFSKTLSKMHPRTRARSLRLESFTLANERPHFFPNPARPFESKA